MASNIIKPAYAYTVVYVRDVAKSVEFYSRAFGYNVRRLDESHRFVYSILLDFSYKSICVYIYGYSLDISYSIYNLASGL